MKGHTGYDGNNPMTTPEFLEECTLLKKHLDKRENTGHILTKPEPVDRGETLAVNKS